MKIKLTLGILAVLGYLPILSRAQTVDTVIASGLFEPHSVAVDANNNYYITDSANNRIVRYVPDTAVMTSFAGLKGSQGTNDGAGIQARFFDPKGIVYVPAREGFVVADSGNHLIRLVALNGAVLTIAGLAGIPGATDGPADIATFRFPSGLAVDAIGNVFIADSKNNVIRKLDPDNVVTTVAGGFYEPSAVTVGDNGQLFVADTRNHSIQVIETNGAVTLMAGSNSRYVSGIDDSPFATSALFNGPSGLLWLGAKNGLLISDTGNNTLRRLYYNTNSDVNGFSVETFVGSPGQPGFVNGLASAAKLNNPVGLAFDTINNGFLVVDLANSALRRIQTSPPRPAVSEPRIGYVIFVKDSFGELLSKLVPVTQAVFNNDVIIAILAEPATETFFTFGPSPANPLDDTIPSPSPRVGNTPLPYRDGLHPEEVLPLIIGPQPDVTIKSIGTQDGRRPSLVVQSRFQFKTANPIILGDNPASFAISNVTAEAKMFYTLDGSDPSDNQSNPSSIGPKFSGDKFSIQMFDTNNITFSIRAFRDNYKSSEIIRKEFSPTNYVPNQISFGFDGGEASSDFVGSAGQRFYAPVTLTLLPKQKMYSLQFNVKVAVVDSNGPPVAPGAVGFDSFLVKPSLLFKTTNVDVPGSFYLPIPPAMFVSVGNIFNVTNLNGLSVTNVQAFFNFEDLLFTNKSNDNLLGVGWLERRGEIPLYDTLAQDLINFSKPHDTLFVSGNGEVVLGGYSFVIPPNATSNSIYQIELGRPSATEDGVSADVFIATPTNGSPTGGAINAIKTVRVAPRSYVVGDVAPFRWFNAGDFGDTVLLNNDVLQVFQSAIYRFNTPPQGSDFFDAMDASDATQNAQMIWAEGTDKKIDDVKFGDGVLDVSDVFVTFRRSLDPSLKWFARHWENGVRVAVETPNIFRLQATAPAQRSSNSQANSPAENSSLDPSVIFTTGGIAGVPGQTVAVPIYAQISGPLPIRVLMFNLTVGYLNGAPTLTQPIQFLPAAGLGQPSLKSSQGPNNYAGAWLDSTVVGVVGTNLVGTILISIPSSATEVSAYKIDFEHISASPNGLGLFPQQVIGGIVTIGRSQTSGWEDNIPDDWRQRYFSSVSNPLSKADADPDADGVSNWAEFKAGTNPTDNRSLLRLITRRSSSNAGLTLTWRTMLNKTYVVERSPSLDHLAWTVLSPNIIGTGDDQEVSDSSAMTSSQFYRVRLVE